MNASPGYAVVEAPVQDDICHNYKHRSAKTLGILQIVLGILIIAGHCAAYGHVYFVNDRDTIIRVLGIIPILAVIVIAGACGVWSSSTKSTCSVKATLVLSIFSAVICLGVFFESVILMIITDFIIHVDYYDSPDDERNRDILKGLFGATLCLGFVGAIVAIVASAFCCRGMCCKSQSGVVLTGSPMVDIPHQATGAYTHKY